MKTIKLSILTAAVATLSAGCINQDLPECKDRNIALHTRAYGLTGEAGMSDTDFAQIFFWEQDEFDALLRGADDAEAKTAQPLHSSDLDRELDDYKAESGLTFRTSYPYPDGDLPLYATGIAPKNAFEIKAPDLFTKIGIAEAYCNGKTDLLISDGSTQITGSYLSPFVEEGQNARNEQRELKFRHLTAKLLFVGERSEDMTNNIGVKDVKIRIHDSRTGIAVPAELTLMTNIGYSDYTDDRRFTYYISKLHDLTEINLRNVGTINIEEQKHLDSCYVVSNNLRYFNPQIFPENTTNAFDPFKIKYDIEGNRLYNGNMTGEVSGNPSITFDVTATLFVPGDETLDREEKWENQTVEIKNNIATGDMLCPGYMYKIIITFDRAGIALRAEQVPWEDGGIHVQPVTPKTGGN